MHELKPYQKLKKKPKIRTRQNSLKEERIEESYVPS